MQNLLKFSFLFIVLAFSNSSIRAQNAKPISKKATTIKVKSTTKSETFYVDVRTPEEFAQGSVIGAVNIPLDQIEKQLVKFNGRKKIVVFCRSGNRSSQAKIILEQKGFKNVVNGGSWLDVNKLIIK